MARQNVDLDIVLSQLNNDMRALDTKIAIIVQRIKYVEKHEKILAQNLISLNNKVKELESGAGKTTQDKNESGFGKEPAKAVSKVAVKELESVKKELENLKKIEGLVKENSSKSKEILIELKKMKDDSVNIQDFNQLRYVIDTVNPLQFITFDQVEELIEKKFREKKL
ncbi:MAG: hypothetical protein J7K00_04785 [Candidatus Diapherotrites archaeon]|nr:hypothetical protein [Candidatus Diapherotrites archaeon]